MYIDDTYNVFLYDLVLIYFTFYRALIFNFKKTIIELEIVRYISLLISLCTKTMHSHINLTFIICWSALVYHLSCVKMLKFCDQWPCMWSRILFRFIRSLTVSEGNLVLWALTMHVIPSFLPFHSISNSFWGKFGVISIDHACDPKFSSVSLYL